MTRRRTVSNTCDCVSRVAARLNDRRRQLAVGGLACVAIAWAPFQSTVAGDLSADDDPSRPTAVETVNVPVISNQLFVDLLPFQSVRRASFAGWAPDGKGILIRTRFGNAAQLHRVYRPGGRREQVTFFSEPPTGRFVPARSSGEMVVSMSRNGDERYQLYLLEPNAYSVSLLTDGRSRHTLGPFSADGNQCIVRSNQRNGRDMDLYVANPLKRDSLEFLIRVEDEYWYASHWAGSGAELLVRRHVSEVESYPAIFDFKSRKVSQLPLPTAEPAAYTNLRFSPDASSIYLSTDAFGEFRELVRFDRNSGKYERLTTDIAWNIDDVSLDRKSGALAFTVNQAGTSRLFVRDALGERREYPLRQPCIVKNLRFSPDGADLGFTLCSPTKPEDVYSLKLADGKLTRWTFSVVGGLDPNEFVRPELIQFPAHDGRDIDAFCYRPDQASAEHPVPVIISIHGGPESQYRPYFSPRLQFLIDRLGCAVICPNVRGSTGYGKTFVGLDDRTNREESVRDIGSLLDWIATQPDFDSQRVVVIGRSYGGYMVLASMIRFNDRLCAGIEEAGIANFTSFLEKTEVYRQARRRVEYGDERTKEMRDLFQRINPTRNAEQIRAPLLVVHGKHDPRVPFGEAEQIVEKLADLDREVWAVYVGDEGHSFNKRENTDYIRAVEVAFLKRQLKLP